MSSTQNAPAAAHPPVVMKGEGFILDPSMTLTAEDDTVLYQVIATDERCHGRVKPGEVGGYLTTADNLTDDAWVYEGSQVVGFSTRIRDNATVRDSVISGMCVLAQNADVRNSHIVDSVVRDGARLEGCWIKRSTVYGKAFLEGSTVRGGSSVGGAAMVIRSEITGRSTVSESSVENSVVENSHVLAKAVVRNSSVLENSTASGPVEITEGSVLEGSSKVSNGSRVIRSTISGGSQVEDDGEVVDSTVRNNSVVWGAGVVLRSTLDGITLQAQDRVMDDSFTSYMSPRWMSWKSTQI